MLIHSVFFWLKPELSSAQHDEFLGGLESLHAVSAVKQLHIGRPAPIEPRPVVDASYSFALTAIFDDVAGQNAYQVDPVHKAFVEKFRGFWTRVQIYDAC